MDSHISVLHNDYSPNDKNNPFKRYKRSKFDALHNLPYRKHNRPNICNADKSKPTNNQIRYCDSHNNHIHRNIFLL